MNTIIKRRPPITTTVRHSACTREGPNPIFTDQCGHDAHVPLIGNDDHAAHHIGHQQQRRAKQYSVAHHPTLFRPRERSGNIGNTADHKTDRPHGHGRRATQDRHGQHREAPSLAHIGTKRGTGHIPHG